MFTKLTLLLLAGGLGTLARYGLGGMVSRYDQSGFPWGTLAVNLLGCFLVGLIGALMQQKELFNATARTLMLIGFMGAFTTFSAYIFETSSLIQDGLWLRAAGNFMLQNVGGFTAFALGFFLVRSIYLSA